MFQASSFECLSFDPFSVQQDGLAAPEVDVGGRKIAETFVVSAVIVMTDEVVDLSFQIPGQIIVLQQDAVLERLMPTLNLTLRHRMVRRAANVFHDMF